MSTMKAIQVDKFTQNFSDVRLADIPVPTVHPGHVLVRVAAAAVNPVDVKVINGNLDGVWETPLPLTPGYDLSGTVAVVGSGVTNFAAGDEVFAVQWGKHAHNEGDQPVAGALAQYVAVPAERLSRKPPALTHQQAAASALVGTTAHQVLFAVAKAERGSRVLILGGAGSVGLVAVQLAKLRGVTVITTASPRTRDFVASLGPDRIIDYTAAKWDEDADLIASPVDAIIDLAGEKDAFARRSKVLKPDGVYVSIVTFDAGFDPAAHPPLRFGAFYCLENAPAVQDEVAGLIADGRLRLPVDTEFPFSAEGVQKALTAQAAGKAIGKYVVVVDPAAAKKAE